MQDEQLCNNIKEMNRRVGPEIFMRHQAAIMGRPDSRNDLSKIKCPTLILCGRQDALTPLEVHEEMSSTIPKARLAIIEDCGHMTTMERPHAVTALLRDWLLYFIGESAAEKNDNASWRAGRNNPFHREGKATRSRCISNLPIKKANFIK
jgi:hypothetical protein